MVQYNVKEILKILPHRYPFLLVDKILEVDLEKEVVVGKKNVTYNEHFFQGHFPGAPIMPGVLILEALAQTGGVLVYKQQKQDKIAVLLNMDKVKFRTAVKPGDVLMLHCEGIHLTSKGGRIKATASVEDKVAVSAEIGFVLVDKKDI